MSSGVDDLPVIDIPSLDRARAAINFYQHYIVNHEAAAAARDLAGLPTDLQAHYDHCFAEAEAIYRDTFF